MEKVETLLIDADDTAWDLLTPWVNAVNKKFGTNVSKDLIKQWDVAGYFPGLTKEEVFSVLNEDDMWNDIKLNPNCLDVLNELRRDGAVVYICTATHFATSKRKFERLMELLPFLQYKQIITAHHKQMIRGDVLVDDGPQNVIAGQYKGILFDQPHNQWLKASEFGVVRAFGWLDVYNIITGRKKEVSNGRN